MKQTIEIEVPEGYKAVYDKDTQKVELVDATLPKTWEEFCENHPIKKEECYIGENGNIFNTVCIGKNRSDIFFKNLLPNKHTAEAFLALMQLIQLRDCYRQGWKPDWSDESWKYCIILYKDKLCENVYTTEGRVLSFQSKEIRDEFLKNFRELIEIAKELI